MARSLSLNPPCRAHAAAIRQLMCGAPPCFLTATALSLSFFATAAPVLADTPGQGFDVIHYDLAVVPDAVGKAIAGREEIVLRITEEQVQHLTFSGSALSIEKASFDGHPVRAESIDGTLRFILPRPVSKGRIARLELTYQGQPARGFVAQDNLLYAAYFTCDWMICLQDAFADKATFSIALQVPAGTNTLAPGTLVSKRPMGGGQEEHTWRETRPYSAYLYGFAVGRFVHAGAGAQAYVSAVADTGELERRFAETAAMTDFLADKAGVPLPVERYSQLLVEGYEAQEAATYSIIGRDALPGNGDDAAQSWAIVHELAHQWWGNLITCETLSEFWLNEGITTFMTAAWKEHRYGRAAYDAELDIARARLAKARDAGFDKPLAWQGTYPSLGIRRAVQYSKGALFMHALRQQLGEDAFWAGLRRYSQTHAGGTVTSIDLQRAMEKESNRSLDPIFKTWVFGEP